MRNFFIAFLLLISTVSQAEVFDHGPHARRVGFRLQAGETRSLANEAFTNMFKLAARELDKNGRHDLAERLQGEWEGHYSFVVLGALADAGDHAPLSEWVAQWYADIEAELGVNFMELSHLRDIWVLNYTLMVVFKPHAAETWCVEQLQAHPEDNCEAEYGRHFVGTKYDDADPLDTAVLHHGFSGVVTYWVVWGICEAATYGGGWFVVCTPAATLAEVAIERYIAPRASDAIWERSN